MANINGMQIEKTANGWTLDGQQVGVARDGLTIQTGSLVKGYTPIITLTAEQMAEVIAEYEALRQARFDAARSPKTAPARNSGKIYGGKRQIGSAKGFDGRGNRVQDGPEWLWK